jgi:hypothetical protein
VDPAGWGIYVQGNGGNRVYNNVVVRSGRFVSSGSDDGDGIAIHDGSNVNRSIYVWNNTVVEARGDGISVHNDVGDDNQVYNNIVVGSDGEAINADPGDAVADNFVVAQVSAVGFRDPAVDDYRLTTDSAAVDAGRDLRSAGVIDDRLGVSRPRGGGVDIGAYESH